METWQQILAALLGIGMLFMLYPAVKQSMQRSKQAEEKHWGTVALLALVLIGFIFLLISSVS